MEWFLSLWGALTGTLSLGLWIYLMYDDYVYRRLRRLEREQADPPFSIRHDS